MPETVDELLDHLARDLGDAEALGAIADEDLLVLGTDPGEEVEGRDQVVAAMAAQTDSAGAAAFDSEHDRRVRELGDVAWFAEHGRLRVGDQGLRVRLTGVAVRRGGAWRLAQLQSAPCEEPAHLRPVDGPGAARP